MICLRFLSGLIGVFLTKTLLFGAVASGSEIRTELYSESSHSTRFENSVVDAKVKVTPLFGIERLYLGALLSEDSKSRAESIYNDNSTSLLLGYSTPEIIKSVQGLIEVRSVVPEFESENTKNTDLRLGLIHYNFYKEQKYLGFETYGEAIYSSRLLDNVFGTVWARPRYSFWRNDFITTDLYAEGYFKRDRLGHYYENLQEFRLGLLGKIQLSKTFFQLQIYQANGQYQGREFTDKNPYSKEYSDGRALLVFGGNW
jgi:hypothetical protein